MNIETVNADENKVSWNLKSSMKYPSNIMLLFLNMEKLIGNDLEIGLSNLKKLMESK